MTRLDTSLNIIVLAMLFAISFATLASAQTTGQSNLRWLWPQDSIAVNQSTIALISAHHTRAIQSAQRGLVNAKGNDRLIAMHNICIGWLRLREPKRAETPCSAALLAAAEAQGEVNGQPIGVIVKANIERERSAHDVRLAKAKQ